MEEKNLSVKTDDENKLDIISFLFDGIKCLRVSWWLLLLLLILGAGAGFLKEKLTYTEQYEASASFVVTAGEQSNVISSKYYNKISAEQLNATFPYILTSGALSKVVANDLGLGSVPGTISAQMMGDTNLFQIRVVASTGQMAYDILQSVVENYPTVARYVIGNTQLKLLDETGVPESPMNPLNYKRSVLLGMIMGILLYAVIVFMWVVNRKTIKSYQDLKKVLNVKYLGGIPQVHFKRRSRKAASQVRVDNPSIPNTYRESMETLQVRLLRELKEKQTNAFLVTSALAGEGKTTTACNIALYLAEKGYRVLLIDGDLRNPSVAEHLQLKLKDGGKGLCDVLSGEAKAKQVIQQYKDTSLQVIPGGEPHSSVSELYTNGVLKELIGQYKAAMDYVVVDTPPCTFMHDTTLIASVLDTGIMVIRQDFAHVNKIVAGVEILSQSGLSMAGCVINGETAGIGSYGYGRYGYGRYGYGYGRYGYGRYGGTKDEK